MLYSSFIYIINTIISKMSDSFLKTKDCLSIIRWHLNRFWSRSSKEIEDQQIERYLVKKFWPELKYVRSLPKDFNEVIKYDYCSYTRCELDVYDFRILDVPSEVEKDFLRLYNAKREGQYNYFKDMSFYLDHVEECGLGRSNFFWSYIRNHYEDIGFEQALEQAKIIIELGLLECYDRYDVEEALGVAFYDSRAIRFLKEVSTYSWHNYTEALKKASTMKFSSYEKYHEFLIGYVYGNDHISFLKHYTHRDFYNSAAPFYEKNFRQVHFFLTHEGMNPRSIKWDIPKQQESEEEFLRLVYGTRYSYHWINTTLMINNTLLKEGYFEEMSDWYKTDFFMDVFNGKLKEMVKNLVTNLKCSSEEAVRLLKLGIYNPESYLWKTAKIRLPQMFVNNADWLVCRWWSAKKDSAAWYRERITYGPEGREFRFKYIDLLDEIRPEDLVNGEKTSPDKAIEHACQRRQLQAEAILSCDWAPLPECELKGNEEFKQLTTPADLVAAGKHFSNCVATYVNACKDKRCYIFVSNNICSEIYQDSNNNWRVRQCLSFHNSYPTEEDKNRFDAWLGHAILVWRKEQEAKQKKLETAIAA